ncbi:hypothetical protein BDM02DRAFT_3129933 [Thelephora ganbajun]|uniref:Uncharacterized protein n=1 Tax=Thelephora ganbajun TaxID=370292 RepID=A0ACB6ZC85_THEGA|nr:hypothetical protein BDM02DRAFT_3129933 [Thelephora ganbajun]
MFSRSLLAHISLALALGMGVSAQVQMAQCLSGWEWNRNHLDQDPCTVGSILDAACRGRAEYNYQKLNKTEYYVPPSKNHTGDVTCDCNTMMYRWETWATACDTVYITQYPVDIPQGTAVPRWAFYNVTLLAGEKYDDNNAKNIGRDPEELPKQQNTATKSTGPTATGNVNKSSSKTAAIVGGVVGGVGSLIIIPIIVYLGIRCSRRNKNKNPQPQYQYQEGPDGYWKTPPNSATYNPSVLTGPSLASSAPQPYNPEDPSTYPPPMPVGQAAQPPITYVTPLSNYGNRR